jgi:catechol 2,3-dioxygenase-like lactoylglutathione lyase family enzyme
MLDHIGFSVSNIKKSRAFYEGALKPLGVKVLLEVTPKMTGTDESHLGFGDNHPFFWIGSAEKPSPGMHVAFLAQSRKMVDEFMRRR